MHSPKTRKIALAGAFTALTCAATALLHFPSPLGGYFNLGDTLILLSVLLLGKKWGTAAGALGASLADLILAYFLYAPATLLIKAAMALSARGIFRFFKKGKDLSLLFACLCGELVMAGGYFLFELFLYGPGGSWENLLFTNLPQGAVNALSAAALYALLRKKQYPQRLQRFLQAP